MITLTSLQRIGKILRADQQMLKRLADRMAIATGRMNIYEKVLGENERVINERLLSLGIPRSAWAKDVYNALIAKIDADDKKISKLLNRPVCDSQTDCQSILETARKVAGQPKGFFLKTEKAKELLTKEPPKNILRFLGYDSVPAMLEKENIFEVMSALRFLEPGEWLNTVFFKQYEVLTPADFEEREIQVFALGDKWDAVTEKFVQKKYHNISHLKELGVVFVIPISLGISGELMRTMGLIFHYLHEIPFYSDLFRKAAENEGAFAKTVISLLRGDVLEKRLPESDKAQWLVVQRYLAKDDENDWRLFTPRINPEAIHWLRAAGDIAKLGKLVPDAEQDLSFWYDLDWVGDDFPDETGVDILVSFNMLDTAMSLVMQKDMIKYLYHHQEALWNKIFMEYYDIETLERMSKENIIKGWLEV